MWEEQTHFVILPASAWTATSNHQTGNPFKWTLVTRIVLLVCLVDWAIGFYAWFGMEFVCLWFCFWCQGATPQWEGTYVVEWRLGLGLVGGWPARARRFLDGKESAGFID